jgi:hypothetical protein
VIGLGIGGHALLNRRHLAAVYDFT